MVISKDLTPCGGLRHLPVVDASCLSPWAQASLVSQALPSSASFPLGPRPLLADPAAALALQSDPRLPLQCAPVRDVGIFKVD